MNLPPMSQLHVEQDFLTYLLLAEEGEIWELSGNEPTLSNPVLEVSPTEKAVGASVGVSLEKGSQAFYAALDQVWQTQSTAVPVLSSASLQEMWKKFGNVPQGILQDIARQAQVTVQQSQAGVDAAIACVQALLPQWSTEDLQVFNRPLVYAMRSAKVRGNIALPSLQNQNWDEISDFDRARIYLAIAHYVINTEPPLTP